jgi:HSP20 family protein
VQEEEAVEVNTLAKRERGTFADLFDWLESEFPSFPMIRPLIGGQMMRVEESFEDGYFVVRGELPGIDPEKDLEIEISNDVLTVKAERREQTREAQRSEFRYGRFSRSVSLPAGANEEDVQATYKDGILTIRVGMKEQKEPQTRRIPVSKD